MSQRKLQKTSRTYVVAPQKLVNCLICFHWPSTLRDGHLYPYRAIPFQAVPLGWSVIMGHPSSKLHDSLGSVRAKVRASDAWPAYTRISIWDAQILRYPDTQMPRYPGTQIHDGCRGVRKRRTEGVACTLLMSTNWAQVAFSSLPITRDPIGRKGVQFSSVQSRPVHFILHCPSASRSKTAGRS